jgi:hypoxanthine phosphoribosyltransferase
MKYIPWNDIDNLIGKIVKRFEKDTTYKYVYGIPRGGLVLAVTLSHHLSLEFLQTLPLNNPEMMEETLVVDDIIDKGDTAKEFQKKGCKHFVCLHYKPESNFPVAFAAEIKTDDEWILYPWESDKSEQVATRRDYK